MTKEEPLTLEHIADRLFDLAESERYTSSLTAIQAYQAAANVLSMAGNSLFGRMFEGIGHREDTEEESVDEPQAS